MNEIEKFPVLPEEEKLVEIYNSLIDISDWLEENGLSHIRYFVNMAIPFVDAAGDMLQSYRFGLED